MYALADLNKFEADIRGEFGIGSAAQFGSADLKSVSVSCFFSSFFEPNFDFLTVFNPLLFYLQESCPRQ